MDPGSSKRVRSVGLIQLDLTVEEQEEENQVNRSGSSEPNRFAYTYKSHFRFKSFIILSSSSLYKFLVREGLQMQPSSPINLHRSGAVADHREVAAPPRRNFFFCPIQFFFSFLTILFRSNHESGLSFSRKSTVKRRSKFEV